MGKGSGALSVGIFMCNDVGLRAEPVVCIFTKDFRAQLITTHTEVLNPE